MTQIALERRQAKMDAVAVLLAMAAAVRLKRLFATMDTWRRRHKASMQCARIETRILRDLGISEARRFIEVNKPFWEK
jgi:uncharacterized protein YjiS (DUF1127 family)